MSNVLELQKKLLDKIGDPIDIDGKEIWIYGAGNTAQLLQEGLLRHDTFVVKGYCDGNPEKWNTKFNNMPVISPDDLKRKENVIALICSANHRAAKEIGQYLSREQIEWDFLERVVVKLYKDKVVRVLELLDDDKSREIYVDVILYRIGMQYLEFSVDYENRFMALDPFREISEKEVFVDCGAYVGDTVEQYIYKRYGLFQKIIAFEPNKKSYLAMKARVERLCKEWNLEKNSIIVHPFGVGDKNETMYFDEYETNHGLSAKYVEKLEGNPNCCENRIVALDDFLEEDFHFLKADIESFEYKMLCGAKKCIEHTKPRLAISIYHNIFDIIDIPILIKEMVPEYHLGVRHHSMDFDDTFLYAWIEEKELIY